MRNDISLGDPKPGHRGSDCAEKAGEALSLSIAKIRGWLNYYGRFRQYEMAGVFMRLNFRILNWSRKKYKSLRYSRRANYAWLKRICNSNPALFVHWDAGFKF